MSITYRPLGQSYLDNNEWPALMRKFEGYVDVPYDDGKHIATIGIGVNLRVRNYLARVLQELGVFAADDIREAAVRVASGRSQETTMERNKRYNRIISDFTSTINSCPLSRTTGNPGESTSEKALQKALNTKVRKYLGNTTKTFTLSEPEAYNVKKSIVTGFTIGSIIDTGKQQKLDNLLTANSISINHDTAEYKIIMSLYYNLESLVGPGLLHALKKENRAEAWFEIRYGSNRHGEGGIAKRRYAESQIFGLYNPTITPDDTRDIYRMLQLHRDTIYSYERTHGTDPNGSNPDVATNWIIAANNDYNLTGSDQVQTLTQILDSAKGILLAAYPQIGSFTPDRSVDIYLDPGRDNALQSLNPNHSAVLDARSGDQRKSRDILIGEGGNDILWGGKGDDLLLGGTGFDTYNYRIGDGTDRIIDEDNKGRIVVRKDGVDLDKVVGTVYKPQGVGGSNVWKNADGSITVTHNSPWTIVLEDGSTIELGENLQDGDFGIHLIDIPNDPVTTNTILGDQDPNNIDDVLYDTAADDRIEGGDGNDYVWAELGGSDHLLGEAGTDSVGSWNESGEDIIEGGSGSDILWGGPDDDKVFSADYGDMETLIADGETAQGIYEKGDIASGNAGNDFVYGANRNDALFGGEGHDLIVGGGGDDAIIGDNDYGYALADWSFTITQGESVSFNSVGIVESTFKGDDAIYAGTGDDFVYAGGGGDEVYAGDGIDTVIGEAGDDFIEGGAGDDILEGDASWVQLSDQGNDYIDGGADDDKIWGQGGSDELFGGDGDDELYADDGDSSDGDDYLDGEAGNDSLYGFGGNDEIFGGDGNDYIEGDYLTAGDDYIDGEAGNDTLIGAGGSDQIYGGDGDDTLGGDASNVAVSDQGDDYIEGGAGDDSIVGYAGNDELCGDEGTDTIYGNEGDDYIDGGLGNDTIYGNEGDDYIDGGLGNDTIYAGDGDNEIYGDDGIDQIAGGAGNDYIDGGGDADIIASGSGDDEIYGGDGDDQLQGDAGNDYIDGEGGNNTIVGLDGDDTLYGGDGNDSIWGGSGNDEISGGAGNDNLYDEGGDTTIYGDDGNDWLQVTNGTNYLDGGLGNDSIYGGSGNDELDCGEGDDYLVGNNADDTYIFGMGSGVDVIYNYATDYLMATDTVEFGEGITSSNLDWVIKNGDLHINVIGSSDLLVIQSWFNWIDSDPYQVDQFKFSNGETLTAAQLNALGFNAYGTTANDTLYGSISNDKIYGYEGNDFIVAMNGDDLLDGGAGNDTLRGDAGVDTMIGGTGNDRYYVDNTGDVVTENANEGTDTVESSITYTLSANVEYLCLTGSDAINATGNAQNNEIYGNSNGNILNGGDGVDTLYGMEGDDTLDGGTGDDVLCAGGYVSPRYWGDWNDLSNAANGNDAYLFGRGSGQDTIFDWDASSGNVDTILLGSGIQTSDVTLSRQEGTMMYEKGDGLVLSITGTTDTLTVESWFEESGEWQVERIQFADGTVWDESIIRQKVFVPTNDNDYLYGTSASEIIQGLAGDDTLYGAGGNDTLYGDEGDDTLNGDDGNDTLNGGVGNDYLRGDDGNDNLNGGVGNDYLSGGAGDDTLNGDAGADNMCGDAGNDTYIVDNVGDIIVTYYGDEGTDTVQSSITYTLDANLENLTLTGSASINGTGNELNNSITGNSANNVLSGGDGNDTLNGGTGADTMIGGTGNDRMYVDNTGDVVTENAGEGTDRVYSYIDYTLGSNVENLTLSGSTAINGTGNELNNSMTGNSANNVLSGGDGNDTLNGGAGADTMTGGIGNDRFYVDNTGDVVTENASEGTDTVYSYISYTLGANVENLTLTGTAAVDGTGNELNNILTGNSAANVLAGGAGNDTYNIDNTIDVITENADEGTDTVRSSITYTLGANIENLTLTGSSTINGTGNEMNNSITGNTADNILSGGDGNDTLNGGTGADTMIGGLGNDRMYVDNTGDVVTENAGEGTDAVYSYINYTLGANVENLVLSGSSAINGTGNELNNSITGNSASNVLNGSDGNDTLNGGSGTDTMIGGLGNDRMYVDNTGDVVTENAGEGTDRVYSYINYTLGANVENLTLSGTAAINGAGNASSNSISGNSADNILDGGAENDTLTGGDGSDTYMFRRTDGKDTITETAGISGDTDTVKMTDGITETEPVIVKQNNDLYLFIDENNYMKVTNEFYQANYGIERLEVTDGYYIARSDIENIINTMSAINNDSGMDVIQKFNAMRVDQTYINTLAQSWHQP